MFSYLTQPLSEQRFRAWSIILGHLVFLILLIFSIVFMRERMLHFDAANYAFSILYYDDYLLPHGRGINVLTQTLPLLWYRLGGSLSSFLLIYSVGFVLIGYLVYCLVVHGFRSVTGGLYLVLLTILTVRYKFYAPVGEVYQSLTYVGLVAGWLLRPEDRWQMSHLANTLVAALLVIPLFFTHPMGFLSLGAFYVTWLVYSGRYRFGAYYLLLIAAGLYGAWRYLGEGRLTGYESGRLEALYEAVDFFSHLGDYYVWDRFLWYWTTHYHLVGLLFLLALVVLSVRGKWLSALLCVLATALLAGLALLLHNYLDAPIYLMLDGYLTHMSVGIGLVITWAFTARRTRLGLLGLVVLIGFSVHRIAGVSEYFTRREQVLTGLVTRYQDEGEAKLMAHMSAWDWNRLWLPWAVGVETLMMTTLNNPEQPATIYFMPYGQERTDCLEQPDCFLGIHPAPDRFVLEELPRYFSFLPQQPYHRVEAKDAY